MKGIDARKKGRKIGAGYKIRSRREHRERIAKNPIEDQTDELLQFGGNLWPGISETYLINELNQREVGVKTTSNTKHIYVGTKLRIREIKRPGLSFKGMKGREEFQTRRDTIERSRIRHNK